MNGGGILDSILVSIKKLIGIAEEYPEFDADIIMHINSVFSTLTQLGVGPETGFRITGEDETWDSFLQDETKLEFVKSYIYLRVKMLFDPPLSSTVIEAYKGTISELEWRLNVAVDP